MTTDRDIAEISRLLPRETTDLLAELSAASTDAFPRDAIDKGLRLYERWKEQVRDKVCGDAGLQVLVNEGADELTLATALYDLVAGSTGHLPAATVVVLLVKQGIDTYCAKTWA